MFLAKSGFYTLEWIRGRSQVPEGAAGSRTAFGPLVDVSPDVISLLDAKGEVLFHSLACGPVFGHPREALVGKSALLPIHPEDRERVSASMAEVVARAGTVIVARYRHQKADGSWIWIESTQVSRLDDPEIGGIVSISRDVSACMAEKEQLERRVGEKEDLVREIQHRVKNSIAMISSFLSLEEGRVEDPSLRTVLENLRFRVDSVSNLYRQLLATGDPGKVNLRLYLERLALDLLQTFDRSDLAMRTAIEDISLDARRAGPLGILCTELISNALRHGLGKGRPGSVSVSLVASHESMELRVSDDGWGLPEGFALEEAAGLGLQIAGMLAMQLKGRLDVSSPETGGTCFVFTMPLRVETPVLA